MHGIDVRLMCARRERRQLQLEAVKLIRRAAGGAHVRPILICAATPGEVPVNIKLHLDTCARPRLVNDPTDDCAVLCTVNRTAKERTEGVINKCDREG